MVSTTSCLLVGLFLIGISMVHSEDGCEAAGGICVGRDQYGRGYDCGEGCGVRSVCCTACKEYKADAEGCKEMSWTDQKGKKHTYGLLTKRCVEPKHIPPMKTEPCDL